MTTKQQYETVITSANSLILSLVGLENTLSETDLNFNVDIDVIEFKLNAMVEAANLKIDEIEQEQVMASFLSELKVVFEKYSASSAITPFEDGYGVGYGEPGLGYVLTASLDGVSSTKEIKKSVINSGDLV